jgi:outer membrane receptor protein involved in Fe transport
MIGSPGRLLLVVFAVAAAAARAQEPAPPPEEMPVPDLGPVEPQAPPPGIESIEVTGERMDGADVQDEAQAITAFSGADLDRASIVNVDTLAFNVPGLHVGQSGTAPIITLRGIGTENASLTGEPGVAFHVDGINMGRPAAARVAFFDLETLDVKRGPQGLLGGKNSTSGSINLVSKKPHDEYEVTGDVLLGNYDRVRMRGALNLPMPLFGEGSAARVAYYHEDRDGYLDDLGRSDSRDPFDADDRGLRTHFKWAASDSFEWLFSYNWFTQGGAGPQADAVPRSREDLLCTSNFPVAETDKQSGSWKLGYRNVVVDTDLGRKAACQTRAINIARRRVDGWIEPAQGETRDGGVTPYRDPATGELLIDPRTNTPIPVLNIRQGTNPADGSRFSIIPSQTRYIHSPGTEEADPRALYLDVPSAQDNLYWGWSTQLDWDAPPIPALGDTHLKLLGGFQHTGGDFQQDFDATDAALIAYNLFDEAEQYSGELQWSGMVVERLEWQTSLFYLHEQASRDVLVPNLFQPSLRGTFIYQTTNNKSYGAALNGVYHATDDLRISLGGRFIKDTKETWLKRYAPEQSANTGPEAIYRGCRGNLNVWPTGGPPGYPFYGERPLKANDPCSGPSRGTMWGAGVDWRPFGADHLLYARLDRGYKSGGFQAGTVGTYSPERIWAYALGSKSEFFDQRLTVNLEGFFYAYSDLQLVIIDGFQLRTENSDARMHGFDIEAEASPIEGLRLGAVVSFLKTETLDYLSLDPTTEPPAPGINEDLYVVYQQDRLYERENAEAQYESGDRGAGASYATRQCYPGYTPPIGDPELCGRLVGTIGGLDDYSDQDLSRSPEWKLTLSGEYEIPLGRFGSLTPRVQYTWQDDTYFRAFNRDFDLQEAHHLTNAKLIWTSPEQTWTVEAFVENIEDETPKQNILIGPRQIDSPPLVWYGPPRFYGVEVGFRY